MPSVFNYDYGPGFRTQTTRVRAVIYHGDAEELGPTVRESGQRTLLVGQNERSEGPVIIGASYGKSLNGVAEGFSLTIKATDRAARELMETIVDDDWIDISFYRGDQGEHVVRGVIDSVSRVRSAEAGAWITEYTIQGSGFGRVFADTKIWFDRVKSRYVPGSVSSQLWAEGNAVVLGSPDRFVQNLLFAWFKKINEQKQSVWLLPNFLREPLSQVDEPLTIDVGTEQTPFWKSVLYDASGFSGTPVRGAAINPSTFSPIDQTVWGIASEWADPAMCELYTDLAPEPPVGDAGPLPTQAYCTPGQSWDVGSTTMTVRMRDIPYPTFYRPDPNRPGRYIDIEDGPWFTQLQTYQVPTQGVLQESVVRTGRLRKNAFFASPNLVQELSKAWPKFQSPLVNPEDLARHGFRAHDFYTRYLAPAGSENGELFTTTRDYRRIIRDFYALDHFFLNGRVQLNHLRPDIRVGHKLHIMESDRLTQYYIQGIGHSWSLVSGGRTVLTVSRGYEGRPTAPEGKLIDAMLKVRRVFSEDIGEVGP